MKRSKLGPRAFCLAIAMALGAMALTAGAAQAANLSDGGVVGKFLVLGKGLLATFTGEQEGESVLLVGAPRNLEIKCAAGDVNQGHIINEKEALAVITYLKCKVFDDVTKTLVANCFIEDQEGSLDEMILSTVLLLPKLHEGKLFVLVEGDAAVPANAPLKIIKFEKGKGCALPLKNEVKGSTVPEATPVAGTSEREWLLTFSEAIQKLFQVAGVGDKLKFGEGEIESFLKASFVLKLTGPRIGCSWSVV